MTKNKNAPVENKLQFRIKAILDKKGITTLEFSKRADLHYNTALALVNNKYERIGLDTLSKICLALDVDVSELFEWI